MADNANYNVGHKRSVIFVLSRGVGGCCSTRYRRVKIQKSFESLLLSLLFSCTRPLSHTLIYSVAAYAVYENLHYTEVSKSRLYAITCTQK